MVTFFNTLWCDLQAATPLVCYSLLRDSNGKVIMKYQAFISYASADKDITENFQDRLSRLGVNAWMYSLNRTLAANTWEEIKTKLIDSDLIIFVVSKNTPTAEGQQRELKLVLEKVESFAGTTKIMPILIDDGTKFSDLPTGLSNKNGAVMRVGNIETLAQKVTSAAFPSLTQQEFKNWKFPIPGEWLVISQLDEIIEQYNFSIGDKFYFRSISPMGLLECYAPKIEEIFWISHQCVKPSSDTETDKEREDQIPKIFKVSGMIEIQQRGWKNWNAPKNNGRS